MLGNDMAKQKADEHIRELVFVGNALKDIKAFSPDAKTDAGYELDRIQRGHNPSDFKTIPRVGKGAMELRIWDEEGTYRVLYVAKIKDAVYVLHCFKKTTQQISDHDIEIAKMRYKAIAK